MLVVAWIYVPGMRWAFTQSPSNGIISYLPQAFVLAMSHELLHALAFWYYGYHAIPIPILIPPILGITIGDKPNSRTENFVISLAPVLLTIMSFLAYCTTGNPAYTTFGWLNLFGMSYDIISAFLR